MPRRLALRLAVPLAAVVLLVLVAAGVVVNRAASRSLDETLSSRDEQRLALAAALVEEALERGADGRHIRRALRSVAAVTGGEVRLVGEDGRLLARAGRLPRSAETVTISTPLADEAEAASLDVVVPRLQAPFLRAFNTALLLTGVVSVVGILLAATLMANRVTRPLRGIALAARRLGAGDLGARAKGGPDEESAELAAAFNSMADRLQRSETLRRRAASDLAHDLATPATVLESQLQAMVDGVVPADGAELERARTAAAGLSSVISQLAELTQAEAAPLARREEQIELRELAAETIRSLDGLLRERGIGGRVEAPATPVIGRADRAQVVRALRNVATNAIQHSPPGSEVRIVVAGGDRPTLRVIDSGPGIEADAVPFVFERFYRADRARSGAPGSGIGLTIARELVTANGGEIDIESTGPDGTTVRVVLPPAKF